MDDLQARIATVLGWTDMKLGLAHWCRDKLIGLEPEGKIVSLVPHWSDSLDLMHELVLGLTDDEWNEYFAHLRRIAGQHAWVEANAAQKAEAWLKAKEQL
jgi:hypothetical protein